MNYELNLFEGLTPSQQAAVEHLDGPLLILAGPGSGKTRVITRRILHLLNQGVSARNILAITFTNKAANEMEERVKSIAPESRVWISTFHRFCARLLRLHGDQVGLRSNFSILDTGDQKQAVRRVLQDLDYDPLHFSPEKILWRISSAKNDLITPELFNERFENSVADHWQAAVRRVYPAYQKWLLDSNAVDFDDLLMHAAVLLSENSELRYQLDEHYQYIMVDEYQDTNLAQYQIVAALSQQQRNICVTGDPDQSIYGWRGARIENILRFERDYPDTRVIRLEQNFRSTPAILRAADSLIINNQQRKHKELLTDRTEQGEPVQLLRFSESSAEAEGVASTIRKLVQSKRCKWGDVAIFYRVNSLSRQVELALSRARVPFQVAAGVAFYDRTEVKDLLAYLRLTENPSDESAFLRIVNKPLRGLGKTSQDRLLKFAREQGITVLEAAGRSKEVPKLSKKAQLSFYIFSEMMQKFSDANLGGVAELLQVIVDRTRYLAPWEGIESEEALERMGNVEELVNAARQYDELAGDDASLQGFLEQTALISDADSLEDNGGQVTLMTLHAAKGLEFPVVFILGVEDGILPHERAKRENNPREIEEERRLLFVGITRAQEQLYLTETNVRAMHGRLMMTIPSPFAMELDCERIDFSNEFPAYSSPVHDDDDSQLQQRVKKENTDSSQTNESSSVKKQLSSQKPLLVSGASLLSGEASQIKLPIGFQIGQQVRHPRYGRGTVTDVGGFGPRRTVTVHFSEGERTETFVSAKAPLQPIG